MILQALSDVTIDFHPGFLVRGPGELVTLPFHQAVKVMNLEPDHFKIVKPTPLLAGVAVRWLLPDDTTQGPGTVQLVDGEPPNRRIAVLTDGELRWVHERDIIEIDPWVLIDRMLDQLVNDVICEGEASPKVVEAREWLDAHFEDS